MATVTMMEKSEKEAKPVHLTFNVGDIVRRIFKLPREGELLSTMIDEMVESVMKEAVTGKKTSGTLKKSFPSIGKIRLGWKASSVVLEVVKHMNVVWDEIPPVPDKHTFLRKGKNGGKMKITGPSKVVISPVKRRRTKVVETTSEEEQAESIVEVNQEASAEKEAEHQEESGDKTCLSHRSN